MLRITLISAWMMLVCTIVSAQTTDPRAILSKVDTAQIKAMANAPIASYSYEGERVQLKQNLGKVTVQLREYDKGVLLRANRDLRAMSSMAIPSPNSHVDYVRSRFVMNWTGDAPTTLSQWTARADALRKDPGIQGVYPLYIYPPTGIEVFCPGEIAVKVSDQTTTAELAAKMTGYGLLLDRYNPSDPHLVVLRQRDSSIDTFALADKLAQDTKLFAYAVPNLTQRYKPFTYIPPWPTTQTPNQAFSNTDPLYSSQWHLKNANLAPAWAKVAKRDWPTPFPEHLFDAGVWFPPQYYPPCVAIVDSGVDIVKAGMEEDLTQIYNPDLANTRWINQFEYQDERYNIDGVDNDKNTYIDDIYGWDFFEGDNDPRPESTTNPEGLTLPSGAAHGTACAGIACERGGNGIGGRGAAPFLAHMAVRIFDGYNNFAPDDTMAAAIMYASRAATVISCSWGGGAPSPSIHNAILHALTFGRGGYNIIWGTVFSIYTPQFRGAGSLVFFAAGNDGFNALSFPAADPWSVAIGATDPNDKRFDYSNFCYNTTEYNNESFGHPGPGLDFMAPSGTITTDITGPRGFSPTEYTTAQFPFSGTSSSTPLAAGIGLLSLTYNDKGTSLSSTYINTRDWTNIWDRANDNCDPRFFTAGELRQAMQNGCDQVSPDTAWYDSYGVSSRYGRGRINADKVYDSLQSQPDDMFEETDRSIDQMDPTLVHPRYLKPGFHKGLIAREADYYYIPMEIGSAAQVTVSYMRHAYYTQHPPAKSPPFFDETTSARLEVAWFPEIAPKPADANPQDVKDDGTSVWPVNPFVLNQADHHRLEDLLQTRLYLGRQPLHNLPDKKGKDYVPNRPYGGYELVDPPRKAKDVSFWMMVRPLPNAVDVYPTDPAATTFTAIVDYNVNFEYFPPDDKWSGIFDVDAALGQWGEVTSTPTLEQSVSYSPVRIYGYDAMEEEYASGAPPVCDGFMFPVHQRQSVNSMVTSNPKLSTMINQMYDDIYNFVDWGTTPGDYGNAMFDVQIAHTAYYLILFGAAASDSGAKNQYFGGMHYSVVNSVNKGSVTLPNWVPIEFTIPNKSVLALDYYPFEHLTTANASSKQYILQVKAGEGARVTTAQNAQAPQPMTLMYMSGLDEHGLTYSHSAGYSTQIDFVPEPVATWYTVTVMSLDPLTVGQDLRYQIAVDRYTPFVPELEPEQLPKFPDLRPESGWGDINFPPMDSIDPVAADTTLTIGFNTINSSDQATSGPIQAQIWVADTTGTMTTVTITTDPIDPWGRATVQGVRIPPLPAGDYFLHIKVDSAGTIFEKNEDNNEVEVKFTVGDPGPDLKIEPDTAIIPNPTNTVTDTKLHLVLKNRGTMPIVSDPMNPIQVQVYRDTASTPSTTYMIMSPLTWPVGSRNTYDFSIGKWPTSGAHTIYIKADAKNVVKNEMTKRNNAMILDLQVDKVHAAEAKNWAIYD